LRSRKDAIAISKALFTLYIAKKNHYLRKSSGGHQAKTRKEEKT
jgi:hypothetical protein